MKKEIYPQEAANLSKKQHVALKSNHSVLSYTILGKLAKEPLTRFMSGSHIGYGAYVRPISH